MQKHCKRYHIKSQTIETARLSMIIEVVVKDSTALLNEVTEISSVSRCSLVSHDGEVTF